MFSYNHSDFGGADKGRYNADFGVNNYPLKRLLDIGNIDSCEKLTFTCSSCSYEVDVDVEVNQNVATVKQIAAIRCPFFFFEIKHSFSCVASWTAGISLSLS